MSKAKVKRRGRPPVFVPVIFEVETTLKKAWQREAKKSQLSLKTYLLEFLPGKDGLAA